MSKQKTDESKTENPAEKTRDDIFSAAKVEDSNAVIKKVLVNKTATTTVKANKKMGVYKFLMIYPQDIYMSVLLPHFYPNSFFTKDEWFEKIEEILHMPV